MNSIRTLILTVLSFSLSYGQELYQTDNITTIDIYFPIPNWNEVMIDNYDSETYLMADSVVINGSMKDSVGVKYKGNSTFSENNDKNPLNISLDEFNDNQDYRGFQTLKLSSGDKDPSFLREVLSYEIARKYMQAPRSNFARVSINGNYHGLYSSSESVNSDFQRRHLYADNDNSRFKCNPVSTFNGGSSLDYLGTDSASYYNYYELKSDFGWQDIIDLTNAINNSPQNIEQYLDIDRAIWMSAFNNILVNLDSYLGPFRQNYYLIKDDNNRMNSVVWDLNESFGGFAMVNQGPGMGGPVDLTQLDPLLREDEEGWPLLDLIYSNPTYKRMYIAHMRTIINENFANGWYSERGLELQNLIKSSVQTDPNAIYSYSDFIANLNDDVTVAGGPGGGSKFGLGSLMESRIDYLESQEEFTATPPTISTISTTPSVVNIYSEANISVQVENAESVVFGYRFRPYEVFTKLEMFDDGNHNDGQANDGVYGVSIEVEALDVQYYIYAENNDAGIFSPERAEHEYHFLPVVGDLVINEFMASNTSAVEDISSGVSEYDDWVELYNRGNTSINLLGYHLSDNENVLDKWTFPDVSIAPNEYLIVWLDNDLDATSGLHTNFRLSADGEELFLSTSNNFIIDALFYGELPSDLGYARVPNGSGAFVVQDHTHNANNGSGTAISNYTQNSDVLVYPNPSNYLLHIVVPFANQIEVYDVLGKKQYVNKNIRNGVDIDVSNWEKGVYILRIDDEVRKISVQ
jgi:hypothetical protein